MTKRHTRKTFTMTVTVTVPHWATAAQTRKEVKDYLNCSNNWDMTGPNFEEGSLICKSVRPSAQS